MEEEQGEREREERLETGKKGRLWREEEGKRTIDEEEEGKTVERRMRKGWKWYLKEREKIKGTEAEKEAAFRRWEEGEEEKTAGRERRYKRREKSLQNVEERKYKGKDSRDRGERSKE